MKQKNQTTGAETNLGGFTSGTPQTNPFFGQLEVTDLCGMAHQTVGHLILVAEVFLPMGENGFHHIPSSHLREKIQEMSP